MSSFSRAFRIAALVAGLALPLPLAACSGLTPVYGPSGVGQERVAVSYGKPTNRTERIIYEDLALKLGKAAVAAPKVTVSASARSRALTSGTLSVPSTPMQMTVTANITVTDASGKKVFSGTRSQTADYTTDPQAFASQQAASDAADRAAKLLADTIRLEVLGALAQ